MADLERLREASDNLFRILREETEVDLYQPIRDRVLIMPMAEPDHQRGSGLWVPEEEKKWRAMVMAVGPGVQTKDGRYSKPDVDPGDVVMVGAYIGEHLELDGIEFRLVRAGDILGVFVDEVL